MHQLNTGLDGVHLRSHWRTTRSNPFPSRLCYHGAMNKAFIFDLDGVLIDSERIWEQEKPELYERVFGTDVARRLGSTFGITMDVIYERAVACETQVEKADFLSAFQALGDGIYKTAPLPQGLDKLAAFLKAEGFVIGIVSGSPLSWMTTVTKRLSFESDISLLISLYERTDLAHKPAPAGYIEAMGSLEATPASTVILEDSNTGIRSAKAAGAFTIGLQQNLAEGYKQEGADAYAATVEGVIELLKHHTFVVAESDTGSAGIKTKASNLA